MCSNQGVRWEGQELTTDDGALPGLGLPALRATGLVRTVRAPEFDGVTFHEVLARSALTKVPAASQMPFRWTVNPYRGCSHACRYCLSPATPVLLGDGTSRPLGALVPGDRVVGTLHDAGRRVLVETEVRDVWRTVKHAYQVTTADGSVLVASGDHRLLTEDGWRYVAHAPQEPPAGTAARPVLRPGDGLVGPGPGVGRRGAVDVVGRLARTAPGRIVAAVEDLGHARELVDITTGSGDFVANGVVSHNCYARGSHTYLDLDAGADFDSQVVVKVNADEVLRAELAKPSWSREPVALGTNTDPYQRAEGRYRLMPGIISALADSGTPFSILTKGTLLRRDLPLLAEVARRVDVGLGISLAFADEELQQRVEPGTPTPRARLALVRAVREAGLPCGVMVAPVLPWLTDSRDHLARLLDAVAEAGATGVTVLPLHLRTGAREWYLEWLDRDFPEHAAGYRRVFGERAYAHRAYRDWLRGRVEPLLDERGLGRAAFRSDAGDTGGGAGGDRRARGDEGAYPAGSLPAARDAGVPRPPASAAAGPREVPAGQQALF
ncbi:hypothetical protein GCM10028784_24510 [Myceligenerans cantabricum]